MTTPWRERERERDSERERERERKKTFLHEKNQFSAVAKLSQP